MSSSHWQESRSRENLEKKWVNFFSLELEKWFFISLFPLDFQDLKKKILFLFSIYEILLSYSRSLLDFQDFEEKFLLSLSIVKIVLYLFLFLFQWEMVYFREKYALFRFLWTLCDSPETLTGWKSESGTDQPTDSPDICHFFDTSTIFNWHQKHTNSRLFDTKKHKIHDFHTKTH